MNSGETLRQVDLSQGSFNGTDFELGPTTVFNINNGGTVESVSGAVPPNSGFDFKGSTININADGNIGISGGNSPARLSNVSVNVHDGGAVLTTLYPGTGTVVNVLGGRIDRGYRGYAGSTLNVSGGQFEDFFEVQGGSIANIAGGEFWLSFTALAGSNVIFSGAEFRINGQPIAGTNITGRGILSGTFANGRQFELNGNFNAASNIVIQNVDVPAADLAPILVDAQHSHASNGIRMGQSLTLRDGGVLPHRFIADGAFLRIEGGEVGARATLIDSTMELTGGRIGFGMDVQFGSHIDITGGVVEVGLRLFASSATIGGGEIGSIAAGPGSVVDVSGGQITGLGVEGLANIRGGTIQNFGAGSESIINLFVRQASIDGMPVDIGIGQTIEIDPEGRSNLTAILADGSPFNLSFYFHPKDPGGFAPGAKLTVTRVPEPSLGLSLAGLALILFARRPGGRAR